MIDAFTEGPVLLVGSSMGGWLALLLIQALRRQGQNRVIGLVLIADGFGFHVPKGYIYAAMGFSVGVEVLNMIKRNRRMRQAADVAAQ
mgnify:CR=1 FL=1